ncbi:MAG: peptidylprolyl isomerase [Cellvibrionaceae bacterium]
MITFHTNFGDICIELDFEKAPLSAANFLQYARDGFYTDTIFHRVIPNFMIQGGGFTESMDQKETRDPIENEADNGLKNDRGTLAMARTMDPHSATGQFFINVVDNDFLNFSGKNQQGWGYAVFGKVTDGLDVIDQIKGVKTSNHGMHGDVPDEPIVVTKVTVSDAYTDK